MTNDKTAEADTMTSCRLCELPETEDELCRELEEVLIALNRDLARRAALADMLGAKLRDLRGTSAAKS